MNPYTTTALTIIGGTLIYAFGQALNGFVIEPVRNIRRLRAEIIETLIVHAGKITSPGVHERDKLLELSHLLRGKAAELLARRSELPWYELWRLIGLAPIGNVTRAMGCLIFLSNGLIDGDPLENSARVEELKRLLNVQTGM